MKHKTQSRYRRLKPQISNSNSFQIKQFFVSPETLCFLHSSFWLDRDDIKNKRKTDCYFFTSSCVSCFNNLQEFQFLGSTSRIIKIKSSLLMFVCFDLTPKLLDWLVTYSYTVLYVPRKIKCKNRKEGSGLNLNIQIIQTSTNIFLNLPFNGHNHRIKTLT